MIRSSHLLAAAAAAAILCAAPATLAQTYPPLQPAAPAVQRLQIAAFTGWQVNGDVEGYYGKLKVDDAQSFGASLSFAARPGTRAELIWIYSRTDAEFDSFTAIYPSSKPFSVDTHYFQIGGTQSMRRGRLEPFAGATMGAVWYSPDRMESTIGNVSYNLGDAWRFAFTVGGGANVFLNQTGTLAIHLHARMLVPVFFEGGSIYAGSGGAGVAVSGGIPAVSGDFGVGLVLAR